MSVNTWGNKILTAKDDEGQKATRTLGLTGSGTFTVSLPKKWVENMSLSQGDKVSLFRRLDNSILLVPEKIAPQIPKRVIIETHPEEKVDTILRKTISAFIVGCDEIVIVSKTKTDPTKEQIDRIRKFAHKSLFDTRFSQFLKPYENSKESKLHIRLEVNIDYSMRFENMKDILEKMHGCILALHDKAIECVRNNRPDDAEHVFELDSEIDARYLFAIRALKVAVVDRNAMKNLGMRSLRECLGYRHIAKNLERIADHSAKIAKSFSELAPHQKGEPLKQKIERAVGWLEFERLSNDAISTLSSAMRYLLERDYSGSDDTIQSVRGDNETKKVKGIGERARKLLEKIIDQKKKFEAEEVRVLTLMIESVRRIADYSRGISEVALNLIFWEYLLEQAETEDSYRVIPQVIRTRGFPQMT